MKRYMSNTFVNSLYRVNKVKCRILNILGGKSAEGFVDTAVKVLISVVIGALVLGGLYVLFKNTVLPTLTQRVIDMFNYKG